MTLIDVIDENGNLTGQQKTKPEIHEQGLWHKSAHIWIYNSKGEVFLQLRAKDKDSYPGLLDISAAGHVDSGELPIETAVRELKEEIGLSINPEQLELINVIKVSTFIEDANWQDNEIDYVYFYKFDGDINDLSFEDHEVEKMEIIPIDKFEKDINDPEEYKRYVPHGDYYRMVIGKLRMVLGR